MVLCPSTAVRCGTSVSTNAIVSAAVPVLLSVTVCVGLFVPTAKRYSLGDEVFILLSLMEEKDRLPVAGKVVWITPAGAQGNRTAGIGVQFNDSADGEAARTKIESILAGILTQERPTHTM